VHSCCSTDHHNVLVLGAPVSFPHHISWQVDDVDDVGRGAHAMLEGSPQRHNLELLSKASLVTVFTFRDYDQRASFRTLTGVTIFRRLRDGSRISRDLHKFGQVNLLVLVGHCGRSRTLCTRTASENSACRCFYTSPNLEACRRGDAMLGAMTDPESQRFL
jgi:hypothetical protein